MVYKEILKKLELIESQLDDAYYSIPEYQSTSDALSYVDSARSELYSLRDDIEKSESYSREKNNTNFI
jgi:hypothetical protein